MNIDYFIQKKLAPGPAVRALIVLVLNPLKFADDQGKEITIENAESDLRKEYVYQRLFENRVFLRSLSSPTKEASKVHSAHDAAMNELHVDYLHGLQEIAQLIRNNAMANDAVFFNSLKKSYHEALKGLQDGDRHGSEFIKALSKQQLEIDGNILEVEFNNTSLPKSPEFLKVASSNLLKKLLGQSAPEEYRQLLTVELEMKHSKLEMVTFFLQSCHLVFL